VFLSLGNDFMYHPPLKQRKSFPSRCHVSAQTNLVREKHSRYAIIRQDPTTPNRHGSTDFVVNEQAEATLSPALSPIIPVTQCMPDVTFYLLVYMPMTATSSFTASADFCKSSFSFGVNSISTTSSIPLEPSLAGTPT